MQFRDMSVVVPPGDRVAIVPSVESSVSVGLVGGSPGCVIAAGASLCWPHLASPVGRSVPVSLPPWPGLLNRECPRWINATGRRCRSPSSTCPWTDGERLSVGATGLKYAYAAVPSHQQRVRSVETVCSPRWAALAWSTQPLLEKPSPGQP